MNVFCFEGGVRFVEYVSWRFSPASLFSLLKADGLVFNKKAGPLYFEGHSLNMFCEKIPTTMVISGFSPMPHRFDYWALQLPPLGRVLSLFMQSWLLVLSHDSQRQLTPYRSCFREVGLGP